MKLLKNFKGQAARELLIDIVAILICSFLALIIRFDLNPWDVDPVFWHSMFLYMPINLISTIIVFQFFHLYSSIWKYAGTTEVRDVICAVVITSLLQLVGMHSFFAMEIPRSYFLTYFLLFGSVTMLDRLGIRILSIRREVAASAMILEKRKQPIQTLLIGAGSGGSIILKEIKSSDKVNRHVPCIIDDDPKKQGSYLNGVPIIGGRERIEDCVKMFQIQEIIIAIPVLDETNKKEILEICNKTGCKLSMLPGVYQLLNREVNISTLRNVEIEDLLGREPVKVNLESIMGYVAGAVIAVTGGGGSIGSELCRQIAKYKPKQLLIIDNYENNAYDLQMELQRKYPELNLEVLIASVQDYDRILEIFEEYKPELIYHAAAHKHVPLMEESPCEAVKNNVGGTRNVAKAADAVHAKRMVMISTDKAVRPTNVMGTTKRICEMMIQSYNEKSETEYVAVRFGNVLGSNGSVIPLFKKQIAAGGPVTVTDPNIIRYFMTIPEAVSLVLQAGAYAKGGEIFILDMGEPVKILTLAENLIRLSGYHPYEDMQIKFTGLRPGEKLYEELLIDEKNQQKTENKRIFIGYPLLSDDERFWRQVEEILVKAKENENQGIREMLKEIVPEYQKEAV